MFIIAGSLVSAVRAAPQNAPPPLPAGTHKELVRQRVFGFRRSYYVHVPGGRSSVANLPLVIALHGAFSTARKFERESGLSELADREGFVVIYPQGFGLGSLFRHWNSGHCCGKARQMRLDDVGFVLSTVEDVSRRIRVDRSRIYITGFSNGGMLAYRIAAEHPEVVAAVAVVSGTIGGAPSVGEPEWVVMRPSRPVPVLAVHGRYDTSVPYEGGSGTTNRSKSSAVSVARSVNFWVETDACATTSRVDFMDEGRIEHQVWSGCHEDSEVVLYSLDRWGHEWPKDTLLDGFDCAAVIWKFFAPHRIGS